MKMTVFWDVAPCSLVEVSLLIALMMEAESTSETSVNFYQTTRRNNPEDGRLLLAQNRFQWSAFENDKEHSGCKKC
jgi:hypothetical protein